MKPNTFLKTLSIIHLALVTGLGVFAIFAYLQNETFKAEMDTGDLFIYLVPLLAATGYFASQFIFNKLLHNIEKEELIENKLSKYQTASLIKYMLLEGPALVALVAYFMSGNALHLVVALLLMVYLYVQRPTKKKLEQEAALSREEKSEF